MLRRRGFTQISYTRNMVYVVHHNLFIVDGHIASPKFKQLY